MSQHLQRLFNGKEEMPNYAFQKLQLIPLTKKEADDISMLVTSIVIAMNDCGAKVHQF